MKCGLDIGSTLVKAAVYDEVNDAYFFFSTRNMSKEEFLTRLVQFDIKELAVTGIGQMKLPDELHFDIKFPRPLNKISHELDLQVLGAQQLLKSEEVSDKHFCLVSIGTGTSYTNVEDDVWHPLPFGSFIAGGFMLGITSQVAGFIEDDSPPEDVLRTLDELALCVINDKNRSDILVKDKLPEMNGTPQGEFMIASCGKLTAASDVENACYGIINCVAASTIKDLMMYKLAGQLRSDKIVVVGSAVACSTALQILLIRYGQAVGLSVHIPKMAEYAGALGALSQFGIENGK